MSVSDLNDLIGRQDNGIDTATGLPLSLLQEQRRMAVLDYAIRSASDTAGTSFILDRAARFEHFVVHGREPGEVEDDF